ncbi:hypothetical protein LTR91_001565 [Friedmanniomyces endolithicus]|uniref:Cell wall mannoprotein PIR1-like C-terminal domain-containing protein n=1 Tax=Friedmanniomyces endolithicus TaxID=329885 RepID=A0AAN6JFG2_9PEZI|nr:hypothetical protein LTS09_008003 [Friedmanniomyces endolithicus]KAK0268037.1 hypothetical protein LTR35_015838 [Friedmanniomyces endolithicus]KAK0275770.1 hypothetical protein LTS00_014917 [Friedmanniomyces endolithicus]KAK0316606.1 hypothetical protein LTR01_000355 [Friedmanniomyces endolithicus]KAK0327814.1 hypothetical protein LTR82_001331 [Friedmanniomyces endolithicus]
MQFTLATLALAALAAAKPMPGGVTSAISPSASAPAGCKASYPGSFSIQTVNVSSSAKVKRQADTTLVMTLENGILLDSKNRTGYIAANSQFQFDGPPQAGAIYTAGWSVCSNGSLTIGDTSVFYGCLSGTFYNLYDNNPLNAGQCSPIYLNVLGGSSSAVASQSADGQVTASPVASVSALSDGQPQAATSAAKVSQLTDGQPQATKATTAAAVSQLSDGQIQATTAAPSATKTSAAVTQISDGQIQAPKTSSAVAQISDGQVQASAAKSTTAAAASTSVQAFTGGAMPVAARGEFFGIAAGLLAVAIL